VFWVNNRFFDRCVKQQQKNSQNWGIFKRLGGGTKYLGKRACFKLNIAKYFEEQGRANYEMLQPYVWLTWLPWWFCR